MPFEWMVAVRFLREGRFQTVLILAGVAVGVAVLVFLSALITGLQATLVKQTLGSQPHVIVRRPDEVPVTLAPADVAVAARVQRPPQRLIALENWPGVRGTLEAMEGVEAVAPVASGSGFALNGGANRGVVLRGIDLESSNRIIDVCPRVVLGGCRLGGGEVLIGTELARQLGVTVGDTLRVGTATTQGQRFAIVGVFDLGSNEVNARWVLLPLKSAQTLLGLPGGVTALETRVTDVFQAERIARDAALATGQKAESWMELNRQLLVALRSQSSSSYMIQLFVLVAVALGIASVLVVSVVQKSREIGILKAMGTPTGRITRIFLIQGVLVGAVGAVFGGALGTGLAMFFATLALNPDGSPRFPVAVTPTLLLSAGTVALATGLLAAVAPARRAARLDPATVIRNG
ncbi:FtsX-like permease family protein [Corallococcus sp. AS-1-6]|uniref:ABC transporter permease n=1 Tax=Corallococcus sp. AS-1-6 TaxID=2874599 RepID=UPI001CC00D94|nr:FtsX-like permease family protein [Corallococcus sp. AS-1-6]MBZ4373759.1 ABC transporter permease [Corallococcus sp. AS-1-6]